MRARPSFRTALCVQETPFMCHAIHRSKKKSEFLYIEIGAKFKLHAKLNHSFSSESSLINQSARFFEPKQTWAIEEVDLLFFLHSSFDEFSLLPVPLY